jgi:hypothetical protein
MSSPSRPPDPAPYGDIPEPFGTALPVAGAPVRLPRHRPTRGELRNRARLALVLALGWLASELAWFGVRGDIRQVPLAYLLGMVAAPIGAAALCLVVALSAGRLGIARRVGVIAAAAVLPPLALLAGVVLLSPAVSSGPPGAPIEIAYCFNVTLGFALLPMLAAGVALRRTFVGLARFRSALVGSAAGLAGAALVNLHCDRVGILHIAFGHVGAAVAIALAGAFILAHVTRA